MTFSSPETQVLSTWTLPTTRKSASALGLALALPAARSNRSGTSPAAVCATAVESATTRPTNAAIAGCTFSTSGARSMGAGRFSTVYATRSARLRRRRLAFALFVLCGSGLSDFASSPASSITPSSFSSTFRGRPRRFGGGGAAFAPASFPGARRFRGFRGFVGRLPDDFLFRGAFAGGGGGGNIGGGSASQPLLVASLPAPKAPRLSFATPRQRASAAVEQRGQNQPHISSLSSVMGGLSARQS